MYLIRPARPVNAPVIPSCEESRSYLHTMGNNKIYNTYVTPSLYLEEPPFLRFFDWFFDFLRVFFFSFGLILFLFFINIYFCFVILLLLFFIFCLLRL